MNLKKDIYNFIKSKGEEGANALDLIEKFGDIKPQLDSLVQGGFLMRKRPLHYIAVDTMINKLVFEDIL